MTNIRVLGGRGQMSTSTISATPSMFQILAEASVPDRSLEDRFRQDRIREMGLQQQRLRAEYRMGLETVRSMLSPVGRVWSNYFTESAEPEPEPEPIGAPAVIQEAPGSLVDRLGEEILQALWERCREQSFAQVLRWLEQIHARGLIGGSDISERPGFWEEVYSTLTNANRKTIAFNAIPRESQFYPLPDNYFDLNMLMSSMDQYILNEVANATTPWVTQAMVNEYVEGESQSNATSALSLGPNLSTTASNRTMNLQWRPQTIESTFIRAPDVTESHDTTTDTIPEPETVIDWTLSADPIETETGVDPEPEPTPEPLDMLDADYIIEFRCTMCGNYFRESIANLVDDHDKVLVVCGDACSSKMTERLGNLDLLE